MPKKLTAIALTLIISVMMVVPAMAATDPPTNVVVTEYDSALGVSWDAVSGAEGYNVYVDGVKENGTLIASTSYTVFGLDNGVTYSITVTSYDSDDASESLESSAVLGTPVEGGVIPLTLTEFIQAAQDMMVLVADAINVFMQPPLIWFVAFGIVAAGIGIAKRLIPRKRAR